MSWLPILGSLSGHAPSAAQDKVSYNSDYCWRSDAGYRAGTLTQDAPGAGWQEIIQVR
ncbi:exported hypothetical protein [Candidatus Sulfopaludibacter sp. SbA3]|nr:exported hypothetical protein [Candidatus Sulfopaludibacter sp. SbA3]